MRDDTVNIISELLKTLDAHPDREGLRDTPVRYKKFLEEFFNPQPFKPTIFSSEGYNEMIIQSKIAFYSMCEHHLIPFFGYGTIAYIPDKKIIGLSKIARILDTYAHRLQNQERLTTEVVEYLTSTVQPKGAGVILQARHLCMEMRGIQKPEVLTTTSALRGNFKSDARTRSEFLRLNTNGL